MYMKRELLFLVMLKFGTALFFHHTTTTFRMMRAPQCRRMMSSTSTTSSDSMSSPNTTSVSLLIPTPQDMEEVGALFSKTCQAGDVLLLDGDLGAGKTCFARGFVRGKTGDWRCSVTSPTYLLSNTYQAEDDIEIRHMDLYRLSGEARDLKPLDLDHVFSNCISLVEWPSRLGSFRPDVRLEINLTISEISNDDEGDDVATRRMTLHPYGGQWKLRLDFLVNEGYLEDLLEEVDDDDDTC